MGINYNWPHSAASIPIQDNRRQIDIIKESAPSSAKTPPDGDDRYNSTETDQMRPRDGAPDPSQSLAGAIQPPLCRRSEERWCVDYCRAAQRKRRLSPAHTTSGQRSERCSAPPAAGASQVFHTTMLSLSSAICRIGHEPRLKPQNDDRRRQSHNHRHLQTVAGHQEKNFHS